MRQCPPLRDAVAETSLGPEHLIWPVFIHEGTDDEPVAQMPGVFRYSRQGLVAAVREAQDTGIRSIAIFPVVPIAKKTEDGRLALDPNNLLHTTVAELKSRFPDLVIIGDVALDPYTTHGHDGVLVNGEIANDETVHRLVDQAIQLVKAGVDIVAPSDMMDGRIGAIRQSLEREGFVKTLILSYAVKYASSFYGPFRSAVGSAQSLGKADKRTYQMDFRNRLEAIQEASLDLSEGADLLMVKPGMPYLDIIRELKEALAVPIYAYQVSGEYSMLKFASEARAVDYSDCLIESLYAFRRAGASAVLTYGAVDAARFLADRPD